MNNAHARKVLQVSLSATFDEVKSMHKKLVIQHHPDKGGNTEKMKEINEAFSALKVQEQQKPSVGRTQSNSRRSNSKTNNNAGKKWNGEVKRSRPLHTHTVFNQTSVNIKRSPLYGDTPVAKLRNISDLLHSATGSDRTGPKLQGDNPSHWGKSYGPNSHSVEFQPSQVDYSESNSEHSDRSTASNHSRWVPDPLRPSERKNERVLFDNAPQRRS